MNWSDVQAWKDTFGETWMMDVIKGEQVPDTLEACYADERWYSIFYMVCADQFATESLDFLSTVQTFEGNGDIALAQSIYAEFVSDAAPRQVNLPSGAKTPLDEIFREGGTGFGPPNLFDDAKTEVWKMVRGDRFADFRSKAGAAQTALWAEHDWDTAETRERS